jgi:predicted oxidoreductase
MQSPRIRLSPGGPAFSRIVAGVWRLADWNMSLSGRETYIRQCLELGVTTFDHADIYGDYQAEALFGDVLAHTPGLREQMQLVSKCGIRMMSAQRPDIRVAHYDTSAAHIIASAEQSLRNLHTDHLDVLLIHRPDPLMDFDVIAQAFQTLQQAGKVRHFGVSNFTAHQFSCLHQRFPLVTNQVEFSPKFLQPMYDQTFDQLQADRIAPMIWSPLAGGSLVSDAQPALHRVQAAIAKVAAQADASVASVIHAWIMKLPCRPVPITGSGRIAAIADAVRACSLELSREQWFAILEAAHGHPPP